MKEVKVFAPATIANFIVGFDSLGAAIEPINGKRLGDTVSLKKADRNRFKVSGKFKNQLPSDENHNLVMQSLHSFNTLLQRKELPTDSLSIHLEKALPICSGLGSSAASIVATLVALNMYYDYPLADQELLLMAGRMEGAVSGSAHYDNTSPAMLGGMQLVLPDNRMHCLPWFDDLLLVIYYPGIKISTKQARDILPVQFPLAKMVEYGQRLAAFVSALHLKDKSQAMSLLFDPLIEPYRGQLIPSFDEARKRVTQAGALAFGLSGSGPSCFAVVDSLQDAERVREHLLTVIPGEKSAFSHIVKIGHGATSLED